MISRRDLIIKGSLTAIAAATSPRPSFAAAALRFPGLTESLAQLEKACNGRLGVAILDTARGENNEANENNEIYGHRTSELFAMCSTFKMMLAASILQRADNGKENLDRGVPMPTEFVSYSPITQAHAGGSMTIRDLCQAAVTRSDNTAANLLLAIIGGPAGFTQFARSLGDTITRLDRIETSLNEALPGDPRDTTSPAAMVATWNKLLLRDTLSLSSRKQLTSWLIANQTGDTRLRAGLTTGWTVGDKTGSNGDNTTNDVAILWPTNQPPILVAAYLTACPGTEDKRNAVLANVGKLVARSIQSV